VRPKNSGEILGLSAENQRHIGTLAALASASSNAGRSDIYQAVAQLYRVQGAVLTERERDLMRGILQRLARDVEMAIRIALAERLADDPEAPLDLILLLVDDSIEVARPLILRSQRFSDTDLLTLLTSFDEGRQVLCAQRPNIGEPVTERLAQSSAPPVLAALVSNATARISTASFELLVEKSRSLSALQEPLARRPDLPSTLAEKMCAWVSESLGTYLVESGRIPAKVLAARLSDAQRALLSPPQDAAAESGQRLVDKLALGGQLKSGFLLRVLQQGQIELFDRAFARLLGIELGDFRDQFYLKGPKPVAFACRAAGIDRAVFSTVYNLSRRARSISASLTPDELSKVEAIFGTFSRTDALGIIQRSNTG
jgi:uncharacterized protein (DUF2336 family)